MILDIFPHFSLIFSVFLRFSKYENFWNFLLTKHIFAYIILTDNRGKGMVFMDTFVCEIIESVLMDENQNPVTTYGLLINSNGESVLYEDLCTNKDSITRLCKIINYEQPDFKILSELFDDCIFCQNYT